MAEYIVRAIKTPELDKIKIGGHTARIMERIFHERIFSEFAQNVAYKEAEDAFRNRIDDADPSGGIWQGEYWGKHMLSACEAYRYTKDQKLLSFIQTGAERLIACQREDGYIGTYRESKNVFVIPKEQPDGPEGPYRGWNWNIWCRKYTLWGLLECYEVTKNGKLLQAANRHALQLIDELESNGVNIGDTGTFVGMPSSSILKPILILYGYTKNERLLDFAVSIGENWDREDNKCPNLIANALSGKGVAQWYPNSEKWAKAYEMMSCYEGLVELYRVTGTEKYRKAAECFYEILMKYELNPVFSVAYNDVFGDAAGEINVISEPCDAIHFMRVCYELYLLAGDVKYMDTFEKTFFNAFLAGVFNDGKWGARGVRGAGRHFYVDEQAKLIYNHCCVNNMPRAFATMARCGIVSRGKDIVINLYENMEASLEQAEVSVNGTYFADGNVAVKAEFRGEPGDIFLRIPDWCDCAGIWANGTAYEAKAGYFRLTQLETSNEIRISFSVQPKVHCFSRAVPEHGEDDWKLKRFLLRTSPSCVTEEVFLQEPRATVTYGPLLLARSKRIGNAEKEMFAPELLLTEHGSCTAELLESPDVRVKLKLKYADEAGEMETYVCDYASAANEKLRDPKFFSMYF